MRAELYRPAAEGESEVIVGVATWDGERATIEARDPSAAGLDAVVHPTPVAVDDPSLRSQGTRGAVLLQPGDRRWFVAAVGLRAAKLGLAVRFIAEPGPGGWDPASQYRAFHAQVDKLARDRSAS